MTAAWRPSARCWRCWSSSKFRFQTRWWRRRTPAATGGWERRRGPSRTACAVAKRWPGPTTCHDRSHDSSAWLLASGAAAGAASDAAAHGRHVSAARGTGSELERGLLPIILTAVIGGTATLVQALVVFPLHIAATSPIVNSDKISLLRLEASVLHLQLRRKGIRFSFPWLRIDTRRRMPRGESITD